MAVNVFTGSWRITEMELWDAKACDLLGPAFIEFGGDCMGHFRFIAVEGRLDCRIGERDGKPLVEFSWQGSDDSHEASGRGWAVMEDSGRLAGRIYFHLGDDSSFTATRRKAPRTAR